MKTFYNADDCAMSEATTDAITYFVQEDVVHSTSIVVTKNIPDHRIRSALKLKEKASLGLHICLTEGTPLSNNLSTLSQNGTFKEAITLLKTKNLSTAEITTEIKAQIDRFSAVLGFKPTHLDSHQHFLYLSPKGFHALASIATELQISIRSAAPFVSPTRMKHFYKRVFNQQGVRIPVSPKLRAAQIKQAAKLPGLIFRSDDLKFSPNDEISNQCKADSIEVICHPISRDRL